ncbi:MAG: methyltransferase domain-containing protein [Gemmobacter sp.]
MNVFEHPDTADSWDRIYYDNRAALRYFDRALALTMRMLDINPGERVLDAGCGAGVHSVRVAQAGHPVDAIDISAEAIREAADRAARAGLAQNIRFAQEDLTRLSLPDASHARVFSWGVIIHIPDADRAVDELARILRPGGRLVLSVTNRASLEERFKRAIRPLLGKKQPEETQHPLGTARYVRLTGGDLWLWRFDIAALVRHAESRGLRLVDRRAGELTELHMFLTGAARSALFRLNNLWFGWGLPATAAHTNILTFEKVAR